MDRTITVIRYNKIDQKPMAQTFKHRSNTIGVDIVAVVNGMLCPEGTCDWCDKVRRRCRSRRIY